MILLKDESQPHFCIQPVSQPVILGRGLIWGYWARIFEAQDEA